MLKTVSLVNDPGFLNSSKLLHPRFTVGSDMFYRSASIFFNYLRTKTILSKPITHPPLGVVSKHDIFSILLKCIIWDLVTEVVILQTNPLGIIGQKPRTYCPNQEVPCQTRNFPV
jgi:hypothetical protein